MLRIPFSGPGRCRESQAEGRRENTSLQPSVFLAKRLTSEPAWLLRSVLKNHVRLWPPHAASGKDQERNVPVFVRNSRPYCGSTCLFKKRGDANGNILRHYVGAVEYQGRRQRKEHP